ncbi:hypothetical protein CROQUDRAFT_106216 [Cronartium quercuum f. sp. fusiforme G11]|uniref:Uncharacterized protein n=1 Tax=Cronartium quercuum f. sp. fusiforme G11 TaxID=708437 RepID=A0A9P6NKZ1_9BASI|nr:hypothetical protein CROQUDRAFT_106216 [Cronartium quercuum f. sp. fusiforme G11]
MTDCEPDWWACGVHCPHLFNPDAALDIWPTPNRPRHTASPLERPSTEGSGVVMVGMDVEFNLKHCYDTLAVQKTPTKGFKWPTVPARPARKASYLLMGAHDERSVAERRWGGRRCTHQDWVGRCPSMRSAFLNAKRCSGSHERRCWRLLLRRIHATDCKSTILTFVHQKEEGIEIATAHSIRYSSHRLQITSAFSAEWSMYLDQTSGCSHSIQVALQTPV